MNKEENERITYEEFMIMFKNAPRFAYMLYDKAEDEIDRLNNDIKTLLKENEAKEKVIKKQDYVINELEKWLIEYRTFIDIPDYYEEGIIDCLDEVLDKLKELKEEK